MTNKEIEVLKQLENVLREAEELVRIIQQESGEQRNNEAQCKQLHSNCQEKTSVVYRRLKNGADKEDVKNIITKFLLQLGIQTNIKGYHYLRTAITMGVNDIRILDSITKQLYPTVAKVYNTTPQRVERAVRHAIESSLDRNILNKELFNEIFGNSISPERGKPTNSEYITGIVDYVRQNYKFT